MGIYRTVIVKLDVSKHLHNTLQKTINIFQSVCQKHIDYAWYNGDTNKYSISKIYLDTLKNHM